MPSTLTILTAARAILADGWTKWQYGRDRFGLSVGFRSEDAVCFCAEGAIARASNLEHWMILRKTGDFGAAIEAIRTELQPKFQSIPQWNDAPERTQAEVLEVFDRAIARLEPTA